MQFSYPAVANKLTGKSEISVRALLSPRLQNAPLPPNCVTKHTTLFNTVGERLLKENVFSRLRCLYRANRVPVVRRTNQNRINIFAHQQVFEIAVCFAPPEYASGFGCRICLFHKPTGIFKTSRIHVTNRHNLCILEAEDFRQVCLEALSSYADSAEGYSVTG
jgi:hypothetical protein